ncbi:MAG: peptidoglycan-binding protein [Desulfovibrio sp.]|nr:MAG: peptidoglycan-binding protein [Desulfovibrio sp.]
MERLFSIFTYILATVITTTFLLAATTGPARAEQWDSLIEQLVSDGLDRTHVEALFSRPEAQFDPSSMGHKMLRLFRIKYGSCVVRELQANLLALGYDPGPVDGFSGFRTRWAISQFQRLHGLPVDGKPSNAVRTVLANSPQRAPEGLLPPEKPETSPPPTVYPSVFTPSRLAEAQAFFLENQALLAEIETDYGIPKEIAVALLTVETRLGTFLGRKNAFITLASMAACSELSQIMPHMDGEQPDAAQRQWMLTRMGQKAEWAYRELKALIRHCEQNGLDPLAVPGSVYGAVGICQFMPTSALEWGVDGDADGAVNLFVLADALHSMANYLCDHGWEGDTSTESAQRQALYSYNHSHTYVNTIMALAAHLKANGSNS